MRSGIFLTFVLLACASSLTPLEAAAADCVECHKDVTPGIVKDYEKSAMSSELTCAGCHGIGHKNEKDVFKAAMPTPELCAECHDEEYEAYAKGKHALAWIAMSAMPTNKLQPHAFIEGQKGCGGCHKVGLRGSETKRYYPYGMACDSCHTRHLFSAKEAKRPEACRTCHMGFDHPQWEMWSTSKHGSIFLTEGDTGRAPTCQTCHMSEGGHYVMTSWGFLAVRLQEDDKEWEGYRKTILKALQVLDPEGKPTPRLKLVQAGKIARLTSADWQAERDKMIEICSKCHSSRFAGENLKNADLMIKEVDKLMAEAIEIVAALYGEGIIVPKDGKAAYPDLLTFYDAATPIEQQLYVMFLEHRMRAIQGAFHMNPDYVTWYGLAEMNKDLVFIRNEAEKMRQAGGR